MTRKTKRTTNKTPELILAIDPTTRGFAWALLEGTKTLAAWGTVHVRHPKHDRCLARAAELIERLRPDCLVLEDYLAEGFRRAERIEILIRCLEQLARKMRVMSARVSQRRVRSTFAKAKTKHQIAVAIANYFPELWRRLPRERRPWESEDERMSIFDAVALALAFLADEDGRLYVIAA